MKAIDGYIIQKIRDLGSKGLSVRRISGKLQIGIATVMKYSKLVTSDIPSPRNGSPSKLSSRMKRVIMLKIDQGILRDSREATNYAREVTSKDLSPRTMRKYINEAGLRSFCKIKKPKLKIKHKKDRLKFANDHKDHTIEYWKDVRFSDEKKWNLYGADGNKKVYRYPGLPLKDHHYQETVKFGGGSLMTWGVITYFGVGKLHFVSNRVNTEQYINILNTSYRATQESFGFNFNDGIFQQDNASIHVSKAAKEWFNEHRFNVIDWKAQSPDLNIIENTRSHVEYRLRRRRHAPKNLSELKTAIEEEWYSTPLEYIQTLYDSMERRVKALIKSKGSHTKY